MTAQERFLREFAGETAAQYYVRWSGYASQAFAEALKWERWGYPEEAALFHAKVAKCMTQAKAGADARHAAGFTPSPPTPSQEL